MNELERKPYKKKVNFISNFFSSKTNALYDVLHSHFLRDISTSRFKEFILYSNQKNSFSFVKIAFPHHWINILENYNISINSLINTLNYKFLAAHGIFIGIKSFIGIIFQKTNKNVFNEPYIYCFDINENSIPQNKSNTNKTYVGWIRDKLNLPYNVLCNVHAAKANPNDWIKYSMKIIDINLVNKFIFFIWFLISLTIAIISLFTKYCEYSILFKEAVYAKAMDLMENRFLGKAYIFNISSFIIRPLWTYVAEMKGSQIIMLNYAASFQGFFYRNRYLPSVLGYSTTNWPIFVNFDCRYADYLEKVINPKSSLIKVNCLPSLNYFEKNIKMVSPKEKYILVFDVTPISLYRSTLLYAVPLYSTADNAINFLEDIINISCKMGFKVILKNKRHFSKNHHCKKYIRYINNLINDDRVEIIDYRYSVRDLCKLFANVISAPFTSTAIEAESLGCESVFYDPTGQIHKSDRGTQGLKLISEKIELEKWVSSVLIKS
jgi:polysaccharide biosynthesis PFTS motif protein